MTRGFGKGWQALGLGRVGGGGLKGLWAPHPPVLLPRNSALGEENNPACCVRRRQCLATRLLPASSGHRWRFRSPPGRASCFASLDAASSPGPTRVGSDRRSCASCALRISPPPPLGAGLTEGSFCSRWIWSFSAAVVILQEDFPVTIVGRY